MPYIRNTGMNSMSELFAMKKNMAFQAKLDHKMSSMTKDFYHRKFNLNQDIKKIFDDMTKIQSSTGYSLETEKTVTTHKPTRRMSYAQKVYLPPIGVRLVKKYVGIDMKIGKSFSDQESMRKGNEVTETESGLPDVSRSIRRILLQKPLRIKLSNPVDEIQLPSVEVWESRGNSAVMNNVSNNQNIIVDEIADEICGTDAKQEGSSENANPEESNGSVKLMYVTSERRSSRSTFRKRASARLTSQSSFLSDYNMGMVNSKGERNKRPMTLEPGKFLLDYGDGKLHSTMEIPKVKDCSRPWCNTSCKTCRNRTYSRPCFVLVPAGSEKQSMILLQRHLASKGNTANRTSCKGVVSEATETSDEAKPEDNKVTDVIGASLETKEENETCDDGEYEQFSDSEYDEEEEKELSDEIAKLLHIRKDVQKRGYDKDRLEDLAQPRGGPPAEVRFSKTSLKRKQKQLTEKARTQQLSEMEKENLHLIQGKVSVFLALMNQYESTSVPKMVHLPIREDVHIPPRQRPRVNVQRRKHVTFGDKAKRRPLS